MKFSLSTCLDNKLYRIFQYVFLIKSTCQHVLIQMQSFILICSINKMYYNLRFTVELVFIDIHYTFPIEQNDMLLYYK